MRINVEHDREGLALVLYDYNGDMKALQDELLITVDNLFEFRVNFTKRSAAVSGYEMELVAPWNQEEAEWEHAEETDWDELEADQ